MHLIGNLVFLYVFGAITEDFLGGWFVPVYLLLSLASGALEQGLGMLGGHQGLALGASSTIYGLIALAVLWAPQTRVSTFIWFILYRPMVVQIRVLWLAGGFMAIQIFSVWLGGGKPSSEFLHACGIAVGLPLGLLCLHKRWVDTQGGDLLAPERPRSLAGAVTPAGVPWDEQAERLSTAVSAGDRRAALAAYDVLRREHPARLPEPRVMERLVTLCEEGLDFHRAAAIAERAVTAGAASDVLRLRLARIHGQHLGDAEAGLAQLEQVNVVGLPDNDLAEHARLTTRLERRQRVVRQSGTTRMSRTMPVLAIMLCLSGVSGAEDTDGEQAPDPFAVITEQPVVEEARPALPVADPQSATGRIVFSDSASIDLPEDSVYLPWAGLRSFLATTLLDSEEETPAGMILTEEQFAGLGEDRALAGSAEEWEQRTFRFLVSGAPVEVFWEDGWIDTSAGLPTADQLLSDWQVHARLINRRQSGLELGIDGWGKSPAFEATSGVLSWSLQTSWRPKGPPGAFGMPAHVATVFHVCHLGARGTLRLVCVGQPGDASIDEKLQRISGCMRWEQGGGFASKQPDRVGERVGGFRRVMLPQVVFGDPTQDQLVYRNRGLGYAWLLVLLPVGIIAVVFLRRIRSASRPVVATTSNTPGRCPTCGTPVTSGTSRCLGCGKSLVR